MKFPKEMFIGILSAIRTKLLKIFIELDKDFGCLDNLDIDTDGRELKKINNKLSIIIYEDNSITYPLLILQKYYRHITIT